MSTAAGPEPLASASRRWLGAMGPSQEACVGRERPLCASEGAAVEPQAWKASCQLRYAPAGAWGGSGPVAATASAQFWMPPEDPWRWTRGAQTEPPQAPTVRSRPPSALRPPAHEPAHGPAHSSAHGSVHGNAHGPAHGPAHVLPRHARDAEHHSSLHCCCHGHGNHSSAASDWAKVRKDNMFYSEAAPHRETLLPTAARQCTTTQDTPERMLHHKQESTKHSSHEEKDSKAVAAVGAGGEGALVSAQGSSPAPQQPAHASRSQVYRRESTYLKGEESTRRSREGAKDSGADAAADVGADAGVGAGEGAGRNDSAQNKARGADGDGGGYAAAMEAVHHTRESVGALVARGAASAEAVGAVSCAAASRSASCSSVRSTRSPLVRSPRHDQGKAIEKAEGVTASFVARSAPSVTGGKLATGISSNLSDFIWKPQEENAWELWYEKKKKEDLIRRRKEEKRKKLLEQQEAAKKKEESMKKELEEENRKKWLERKKKQQEDEKKRQEEQKQLAEKRALEEAEKHEMRLKKHLELLRKANQKREEMRKEEVQRREEAQRQAEEAKRVRQEECARVLAEWNVRAATRPRPLTGSIFNHDPQASVPKPALDFYNPEPWQF